MANTDIIDSEELFVDEFGRNEKFRTETKQTWEACLADTNVSDYEQLSVGEFGRNENFRSEMKQMWEAKADSLPYHHKSIEPSEELNASMKRLGLDGQQFMDDSIPSQEEILAALKAEKAGHRRRRKQARRAARLAKLEVCKAELAEEVPAPGPANLSARGAELAARGVDLAARKSKLMAQIAAISTESKKLKVKLRDAERAQALNRELRRLFLGA